MYYIYDHTDSNAVMCMYGAYHLALVIPNLSLYIDLKLSWDVLCLQRAAVCPHLPGQEECGSPTHTLAAKSPTNARKDSYELDHLFDTANQTCNGLQFRPLVWPMQVPRMQTSHEHKPITSHVQYLKHHSLDLISFLLLLTSRPSLS